MASIEGSPDVAKPDVLVRAIRRTPEGIRVYDRHAPLLVKNLRSNRSRSVECGAPDGRNVVRKVRSGYGIRHGKHSRHERPSSTRCTLS